MLIIAAAGETKLEVNKKPKPVTDLCWYRLVQRALERLNPQDVGDQGRVYSFGDFPAPQIQGRASPAQVPPLPEWATTPHRLPDRPLPPLSPSSFGGTKALPGELADGADPALADHALRRGTAIHLLLEHLPGTAQADWPALAAALISDAPLRDDALAVAARNLASPPLAPCFAPGALREVAITGEWQGRRLTGAIDRLIVTETEVTLIDFKSNRLVPENPGAVPEGLLRQMAAYAHLLAQIYPGRPLRPFILWTETASLMPLDPDMLMQALDRATIP